VAIDRDAPPTNPASSISLAAQAVMVLAQPTDPAETAYGNPWLSVRERIGGEL
jgi:hypothetical protein